MRMNLISTVSAVFIVAGMTEAFLLTSIFNPRAVVLDRRVQMFSANPGQPAGDVKPDILLPFLPAADPMYAVRGTIGQGEFVVSRSGEPRLEELTNENLYRILMIQCSDLEVRSEYM